MATLLYGTGLRLMEPLRLHIKDVDLESRQLVIRQPKGAKDRVTVLPQCLRTPLNAHLHERKCEYDAARAAGGGRVRLPADLTRKYVNDATSWPWQ